ncbi:LPS export ABC transporter periplasmic protein LptC [Sphingorhabdus lutea]|uniref:LPS export ABC transporter periplasmic protein LptC n=1 Tax=Sphingorhabdus lutea TaxID=1913578 RepID=UPI003AADCFE7
MGKDQATIQAQRADYDIDQEYLQVNGPISLSTMSGYDMVVNNVTFFIKTQRMQSQGAVSGRTNIGTFSANRLNADLKARTITLSGNAQLRIDQNAIK